MTTIVRLLRQPEFQLFIFFFLLILFNWPFLAVSADAGLLPFFLYLFVLWFVSIIFLFLIGTSIRRGGRDKEGDE
jgi:hypothetical protein